MLRPVLFFPALLLLVVSHGAIAQITFFPECNFLGKPVTLQAGFYTSRDLNAAGIANNSISSAVVPQGLSATLFTDDDFTGRYGVLTGAVGCLDKDGFNNVVSSITVQQAGQEDAVAEMIRNSNAAASVTGASVFSECNFRGIDVALEPGKYIASDLEKLGMPNNAISSLRVPRGLKVTVYGNDLHRGTGKSFIRDDTCLIGDQLNDIVSSIVVQRIDASGQTLPSTPVPSSAGNAVDFSSVGHSAGQNSNPSNAGPASLTSGPGIAAAVFAKCGFSGKQATLAVGEYNAEDLAILGVADNSISSVQVAEGYQVELFFFNFMRGKSGYLRDDDSCLINDGFDNEVSSIKVTKIGESARPLNQVDGGKKAATVFQHCGYKGGSVALKAGRYTQEKLRDLGIGNDIISAVKVEAGYQMVLYDNGQLRGHGVAISGNDQCLDDNGLRRRVSSLIITPHRSQSSQTELQKAAASRALDAGLECVGLYVERDICEAFRWSDIHRRCRLDRVPLMDVGYLAGHVKAGNCTSRHWEQISKRIREPSLR